MSASRAVVRIFHLDWGLFYIFPIRAFDSRVFLSEDRQGISEVITAKMPKMSIPMSEGRLIMKKAVILQNSMTAV